MAKVVTSDLFTSVSGKLCKNEGTYIALNKQTGKMYSAVHHHYTNANTEAQQEVKKVFTSKSRVARDWWNANKPSTKQAKGSESYQLVMKAYKSQRKIGNPYSYLRTLVGDDMKVRLGDLDITGSVKAPASSVGSPASGSGSSTSGSGSSSEGGGSNPGGSSSDGGGGSDTEG